MGLFDTVANFDAMDNISSVAMNIGNSLINMGNQAGQAAGATEAGFDAMGLASFGAGVALNGVIAAAGMAVDEMMQVDESMAGVSARTGLAGETLNNFKQASNDLFSTGLVANFDEAARVIEAVSHAGMGFNMTNEVLEKFAVESAGVGKAWGQSGAQVAESATRMMKMFKDLEGDPIKALDILTGVAQKTGRPLQEIEAIVTRFGPKFAEAGLSAVGMGALIVIAAQEGISQRGMGGLSTAIENFHNNIANPSPKFLAAMKDLGLGSVAEDLKANKITMETALQKIGEAFDDPKNKAKTAKDETILFGNAIEQAGGVKTIQGFKDIGTAMDGIGGSASQATDTIKNTLGTALSGWVNTAKANLGQAAEDIYQDMASGEFGKRLMDGAQAIFGANGTIASTVREAIGTIGNIINGTVGIVTGALSKMGTGAQATWNDWFGPTGKIPKAVDDAITKVEGIINGAVGAVRSAFSSVANAAAGALAPLLDAVQKIASAIDYILSHVGSALSQGSQAVQSGAAMPGGAAGGTDDLPQGFTFVGEQGPELALRRGNQVSILSNQQTRTMLGSGGGSGGGGDTQINISVGNLVGSGGMQELARMLYPYTQREDQRRGGSGAGKLAG